MTELIKAVANLYENLQMPDEWLKWVTERSNNEADPQGTAVRSPDVAGGKEEQLCS